MKITTIKDKRLRPLIEDPTLTSANGFEPKVVAKLGPMILAIRAMDHPRALMTVPAWRAHDLSPGRRNVWAMTVTPNFRLTFYVSYEAKEVSELQVEDYH